MTRPTSAVLRRAILATVLCLVSVALVVLAVPSSQAAPAGNCTYFNNASHTTVVGQFGYDCCNNRVAWGVKTRFSQCGGCFVCFPPNP
jgi:polyisoprenoid-binding protein YceI